MDEENMDDKEEQSEESRAVRVGQRKTMTPTLAEREQATLLIEAESLQRLSKTTKI